MLHGETLSDQATHGEAQEVELLQMQRMGKAQELIDILLQVIRAGGLRAAAVTDHVVSNHLEIGQLSRQAIPHRQIHADAVDEDQRPTGAFQAEMRAVCKDLIDHGHQPTTFSASISALSI